MACGWWLVAGGFLSSIIEIDLADDGSSERLFVRQLPGVIEVAPLAGGDVEKSTADDCAEGGFIERWEVGFEEIDPLDAGVRTIEGRRDDAMGADAVLDGDQAVPVHIQAIAAEEGLRLRAGLLSSSQPGSTHPDSLREPPLPRGKSKIHEVNCWPKRG